MKILPSSPSSFLRPGSRFHGTQQSERQVYDVQVEIKYVDFRESFLCGYLKIQGLFPPSHLTPTLLPCAMQCNAFQYYHNRYTSFRQTGR